jgi:hypothetical protein
MPKPKPTEVIVHRLDLQPSLKDSMDAFLIGKTATNALQGVGTILSAFGPAASVLLGWYLADKALDEVIDGLTGFFAKIGEDAADERYGDTLNQYQLVCATLEAAANMPDLLAQEEGMRKGIKNIGNFNPVLDAWNRFRPKLMISFAQSAQTQGVNAYPFDGWGKPLAQRWISFYPLDALTREMKEDLYSMAGQVDKYPWPVGWLWKKATNQ